MMKKQALSFNDAVTEIEEILRRLEEGNVDPDTLSVHVKRASELLKYCNSRLKTTQSEVDTILKELDS